MPTLLTQARGISGRSKSRAHVSMRHNLLTQLPYLLTQPTETVQTLGAVRVTPTLLTQLKKLNLGDKNSPLRGLFYAINIDRILVTFSHGSILHGSPTVKDLQANFFTSKKASP